MRFVASTALAALTVVSASQAALIDSNLPMTNASGQATGYAADAISSGGSYFYSQALAQTFTATQRSETLTHPAPPNSTATRHHFEPPSTPFKAFRAVTACQVARKAC